MGVMACAIFSPGAKGTQTPDHGLRGNFPTNVRAAAVGCWAKLKLVITRRSMVLSRTPLIKISLCRVSCFLSYSEGCGADHAHTFSFKWCLHYGDYCSKLEPF
jgi:hypothetical protein